MFQQDNSGIHFVGENRRLAEKLGPNFEWCPNSPDLSPIENLWAMLKAKLGNCFKMPGDELWERVKQAAREVPQDWINKTIDSFTNRLKECIRRKGECIGK